MILLCPPEKSTQFHYPLDPKKIQAEGSMHKDTTYQGSDRQDFYRHEKNNNNKKKKKKKTNKQNADLDWVCHRQPSKEYKKKDVEAARERSERAKARRKSAIERQEQEPAKKRKFLNESGEHIVGIDFTALPSTSPSESKENSDAMMLDEPCASGEQSETDTASLASTAIFNNGCRNTNRRTE